MKTLTMDRQRRLERELAAAEEDRSSALSLADRATARTEEERVRAERPRVEAIDRHLLEFGIRPIESLESLLRLGVQVSADRIEFAMPRLSRAQVRQLLSSELRLERGRLVPVVRGGVVGMSPASFRNAPQGQQGKDWDIQPDQFYGLTVRNQQLVPGPSTASGWNVTTPLDFPIPKRGVLHKLMLLVNGTYTITVGGGSFTQGWKWPEGVLWHVALQAGGESGIQYGTGPDFRTRTQRLYRNAPGGSLGGAATGTCPGGATGILQNGANTIKVLLDIPVAHDMRTGMGSIFLPSNDLQLTLHVDYPANSAELVTLAGGATAAWTNVNVQLVETYMRVVKNDQGMIVLPDISRIFMTTVEEQYFSNNGPVSCPIPRMPGVLLCISEVLDQGATVIAPSSLTDVRFAYGENQQPLYYLPDDILEKNRRDYNGTLFGGNYYALDGEVDNPARDVWIPRNFTEGQIYTDVPSSITPAANSRAHLFLESLVQANLT